MIDDQCQACWRVIMKADKQRTMAMLPLTVPIMELVIAANAVYGERGRLISPTLAQCLWIQVGRDAAGNSEWRPCRDEIMQREL